MLKRLVAFCIVAACLAMISCQKTADIEMRPTGPLSVDAARFSDAIPEDYGQLVGVTQNGVNPVWVSLWFQKQDRTITVVFVNMKERSISQRVLTIPRR